MNLLEAFRNNADARRFLALALGTFLGLMIYAYGWGFLVTEDNLKQDAANAVKTRVTENYSSTKIGDTLLISFETSGQYAYVGYVKNPLLPLYRRTLTYVNYKPLEPQDNLLMEGFSKTYILGGGQEGRIREKESFPYTTLGFDWRAFTIMMFGLPLMFYLRQKFTAWRNQ